MTSTNPHLQPAPRPLPTLWHRAIANHIANTLRNGWHRHTELRALTNHHAGHSTGTPIPPPHPTIDVLTIDVYAWGILHPDTDLAIPPIGWLLSRNDLHQHLGSQTTAATQITNAWITARPARGPAPDLYTRSTNRHGNPRLRRNGPEEAAIAMTAAVNAATIYRITDDWYYDHLTDEPFDALLAIQIATAALREPE